MGILGLDECGDHVIVMDRLGLQRFAGRLWFDGDMIGCLMPIERGSSRAVECGDLGLPTSESIRHKSKEANLLQ